VTDLGDFKRLVYEPETKALRKRAAVAEARVTELKAALRWYDDHKRDDGSYDGEMWGDLRALAGDEGGAALREDDLTIEPWGRGDPMMSGVQRNPRGVRITHKPTGLVAEWDEEKSQLRNREAALALLREKVAAGDGGGA
jgi:hypothetical protein